LLKFKNKKIKKLMELEYYCCICFDELVNKVNDNLDNVNDKVSYYLDCCKNKIHKNCLITWVLTCMSTNMQIFCPLCKNVKINISIKDLLEYNIEDYSKLYNIEKEILLINLNKLINSYNTSYIINLDLPELIEDDRIIVSIFNVKTVYIFYILYFIFMVSVLYLTNKE
jgi:hypothetical protein